jgi:ABC-2 type transport system ATP-binding protein
VEIRKLIKDLGKEKTVVFSTHIMQEVQALCDRVMIINKGKIVADDPIEQLQSRISGENIVTVEFAQQIKPDILLKINHVSKISPTTEGGKNRYQLIAPLNRDIRADIFRCAVENNWVILEMKREVFSVEEVFQELTKPTN